MISRHRLRGRRRFAAVRAGGLRASSAGVRAQLAGNDLGVARVGFTLVGLRSSVRRNLLRRRLREVVRPRLGQLAGHDLVIIAGAEVAELPFAALRAAVETSIARVLERAESAAVASTGDNGTMTHSPKVS
ncbi:MAG: ribonuclease P protein component [Chloroflexota bacterium]|nr:ribonuclease P protein component [Chloroflexota bacterium]